MKRILVLFGVLMASLTTHAEVYMASVVGSTGSVSFKNDKGVLSPLNSNIVKIEIRSPSVGSVLRVFRQETVLAIKDDPNGFEFRLPKDSRKSKTDFNVSADKTDQNAAIQSTTFREFLSIGHQERVVDCTYQDLVPMSTIDDKGNVSVSLTPVTEYGHQRAFVQVDTWLEMLRIHIEQSSGTLDLRTDPVQKENISVLKELTSCR